MLPDSVAVENLLAERDALHNYLARLSDASTTARERVLERLSSEYQQRLEAVVDQLRSHADTLAEQLSQGRSELAAQVALFETAEDALAEAELRHVVGEYDGATFAAERVTLEEKILYCRRERDAVQERVERLEAVHTQVTRPVAAEPPPAHQDTEGIEPRPSGSTAAGSWEPAQPVEADPELEEQDPIDAAVASIFDDGVGSESGPEPVPEPVPEPEESPAVVASLSDIPPLGTPQGGSPHFSPVTDAGHRDVAASKPNPAVPDLQLGSLFGGDSIVSTGAAASAQEPPTRSQRCSECGAMNKPFEWYCEKCGAELTAG